MKKDGDGNHTPPRPGVIEIDEGTVSFALYAPSKRSVHLLADFNDWQPGQDPLRQQQDGLWVLQRTLTPGRFTYKFLIDSRLAICDPYATEVQPDPRDAKQPRAVFHVGRPPFQWRTDVWHRPALRDLIISEIHIPDFTPQGTFRALAEKLTYLRDLGVNALELLPVQEAPLKDYWGYQPTYFLAARGIYGSNEDLKELIDQSHARGIAIILDVVFAHTSWVHPFLLMYPQGKSPWYGKPIGRPNEFRMPALSYQKPATLAFLRDVQLHWLHEFRVDGLRYDYIASIGGNRKGQGVPYLVKNAREINPDVYCIGEWLPEEPRKVKPLNLDAVWHGRTVAALRALSDERRVKEQNWKRFTQAVRVLDHAREGYPSSQSMVNYVESHDEHRVVRTAMRAGFDLQTAIEKSALLATALLAAAGEPMFYMGQEWGERSERKKNQPNKIHWELLDSPEGAGLHRHVTRMCWLRRARPALHAGTFQLAAIDEKAKTVVWHRACGILEQAVAVFNFSCEPRTLLIPFPRLDLAPRPNVWQEFFSREICDACRQVTRELQPYSAQLFFPLGTVSFEERNTP